MTERRWRAGFWAGLVGVASALAGCGDSAEPHEDDGSAGGSVRDTLTGADAGEIGPGAFDPDYQNSPNFFTRMSTAIGSRVHARQRTWYSTNIQDMPAKGPFEVPPGTVSIKAEYDADGVNFTTVVMIKREAGYDPEYGDWYYEGRNPDGSLAGSPTPGPSQACKGCHSDGKETDYLLGFDIES